MSENGGEPQLPSLWRVLAMPVSLALSVLVLGFGLLLALGLDEGGGGATPTTETQPSSEPVGGVLFASQGCGGCHTLSAAGSTGTVGPSLDESQLSQAEMEAVIANGRRAMPAFSDRLDEEEITEVAAFVAASGGPSP
jgi:mono/diheme cytochrome c family protein